MLENTNANKEGHLIDMGDICYCCLSTVVMCGWEKLQYPDKLNFSVLLCVCGYDKGKD